MDIYSFLDETSKNSFSLITSALEPYGAELFFAGGCVRDALLGFIPKDFDIEVYGIDVDDFEKALESIGAVGVGKSFFVYRLANFDISLPRSETKTGVGHNAFETVVVGDRRLACSRRDFTVNAMLVNAKNGELVDFFGGQEDLRAKRLRAVNEQSFKEDSLRVLRAMQFAARFDFRIEPCTLKLCNSISLDDISKSRIFAEFEKFFSGAYQIKGLYYFFRLGIAVKLFGLSIELKKLVKISRELKKSYSFFGEPKEGAFLYQLFCGMQINKNQFLDKIGAPNSQYKLFALQKRAPQKINDRFLVGLSLKMPISKWLGAYKSGTIERAKKLCIWDACYEPQVTHQKIISLGFKNGEISRNYKLMLSQEIREKFRS